MPTIQKTLRIFEFIKCYRASYKVTPTIAEIGRHFRLSSSSAVYAHLLKLESRGLITRVPNVARGIRLIEPEQDQAT